MLTTVILFKFLLLFGLIRLLMETENPYLCAGIYMAVKILISIFFGHSIDTIFFNAIISGALATLYFWVLDRTMGMGSIFCVIAVVGVIIGFV